MRNEACQPIVRTLLEHMSERRSWVTEASRVPAGHYTDPVHLALELNVLFDGLPRVVALTPDVPEPGSYVTRSDFGIPLVITRADDGTVRAFANVCAHRASQVVADGRGAARRFACPYHAWTYDNEGTLVGLPDSTAFPEVRCPGPGLRSLPVFEDHGVIWAIPEFETDGDSERWPDIGPIGDDLDVFGIEDHRHWRTHRFDLRLNWKLVIDTFLEPYHFASLHRNTVGPLFVANLCAADRFGPHVREVLPRRTVEELRDQPPDTWDLVPHSALVYVLFPNTVLVMQIDHIETWRVRPHPTDPGRSICNLDFYVPDVPTTESGERHWELNWKLSIDTVELEDFAAMEGVQRGLASGVVDELRLGANEPALSYFHEALAEALTPPT